MVKYYTDSLDRVFFALSDPTRRAILGRLAQGEAAISELAEPSQVTLPAVMKHLALLESAALIQRRKQGRTVTCRLSAAPLQDAATWIADYTRFWDERLEDLARYLAPSGPSSSSEVPCPTPRPRRSSVRSTIRSRESKSSVRGRRRKP
jgi:DNA-binding transcriptional ArsR family regulator